MSKELERSHTDYAALVDTIDGIVWEADARTFRFRFVSKQAERLLGYPLERWLIEPTFWQDHLHPDDRDWAVQFCVKVTEDKVAHEFEYRMIAADGRVVWLKDWVSVVVEDGQAVTLRGVMADITERKRVEEALREGESRYRTLVESAPVCIHEIDRQGRLISMNRTGLQMMRAEQEAQIKGLVYLDVVAPEDRERIGGLLARAHAGEASEFEFSANMDQGPRRFASSFIPLRDANGSVLKLMGITRDITEQRQMEAVIVARNRVLELVAAGRPLPDVLTLLTQIIESLFPGIRCSVLLTDEDGRRLRAGAAPSFPEEFARAVDGLEIGPSAGSCGTAAYRREPVIVEDIASDPLWAWFRELAVQHELRACWSQPIFATTGQILGTICMYYREPRGPRAAERSMMETAARLAGIAIERQWAQDRLHITTDQLQAISQAMLKFLEEGNWREASARILRNALTQTQSEYGFIGVVAEGAVLRILAHEGIIWDQTMNREFYEAALRTYQEAGYLEFTNFENLFGKVITTGKAVLSNEPGSDPRAGGLPPGHPPLRHFLGVPILRGAEVVGMIGVANRPGGYARTEQAKLEVLTQASGVLYDSYRRQQRETDLQAQLRQSQKMEAVGRLAGGIAHDFNNLLTVVNGYSDFLLGEKQLSEPLRESLLQIKQAGQRASGLTNQLLAFSRRQVLQPKVLNLNEVVVHIVPMLQRLLREDIELVTALAPDLGPVRVDPGQMDQVVMNLAVNARDAMPQGGRLTVETVNIELDETDTRKHTFLQPGPYVTLSVSDTGSGMDAETRQHLFEPFFTTKELGRGTGLGLSTVYGIVKQSGGSIIVDSEPDRGTRFTIYLPQAEEAAPAAQADPVSAGALVGSETILVVEDEEAVRRLNQKVLRACGYTVLEALDGHEALRICQEHPNPIHLLVTDMVMPRMSGWELAKRLASLRPDTRVLYVSGYTDEAVVPQSVLEAGGAFLRKPFTPDELARKVRAVLEAPRHDKPADPPSL